MTTVEGRFQENVTYLGVCARPHFAGRGNAARAKGPITGHALAFLTRGPSLTKTIELVGGKGLCIETGATANERVREFSSLSDEVAGLLYPMSSRQLTLLNEWLEGPEARARYSFVLSNCATFVYRLLRATIGDRVDVSRATEIVPGISDPTVLYGWVRNPAFRNHRHVLTFRSPEALVSLTR